MKRIVLLSCVSQKLDHPVPAAELYTSTLFRLSLAYARQLQPDAIHILSAKYGLVDLDEVIAPYDVTLNAIPTAERRAWAQRVLAQLAARHDLERDHFIILAGQRYLIASTWFLTWPMSRFPWRGCPSADSSSS